MFKQSISRRILAQLGAGALLLGATVAAAAPAAAVQTPTVGGGTGIAFTLTSDPVNLYATICSLTTVGRDDAGRLIALTNAHCFIDAAGNTRIGTQIYIDSSPAGTSLAPAPVNSTKPDMVTGSIGTVSYVSEPNNLLSSGPDGLDYAVIVLDESKVAPTKTVGGVTISSLGSPPTTGTNLCKQGHRTGITCGMMGGPVGIWFSHSVWTLGGDSGAPVVAGQTLVGNAWGLQMSTPIYSILTDMADRGGPGAGFEVTT